MNRKQKKLPDKFRVFMYLTRAERFRYMQFTTHGNLKTGTTTLCSEIAFPPYGYVMTFDFKGKISYLNEITDFKKFNIKEKTSLNMITYQLPTYMQFPLDYRSETKIESDIDSSLRELEILKRKHLNIKKR